MATPTPEVKLPTSANLQVVVTVHESDAADARLGKTVESTNKETTDDAVKEEELSEAEAENSKIVEIVEIGVDRVIDGVLVDLEQVTVGDDSASRASESLKDDHNAKKTKEAKDEFWSWACRYHSMESEAEVEKIVPHSTAINPLLEALDEYVRWTPTAYFTLCIFFVKMAINLMTICLNFKSQSVLILNTSYRQNQTLNSGLSNALVPTILVSTVEFLLIFPFIGIAIWAVCKLYAGRDRRKPEDKLGQYVGMLIFALFHLSQISLLQAIIVFNYLNRPFNILVNIPNAASLRLRQHRHGRKVSMAKRTVSYTLLYALFAAVLALSAIVVAVLLVIVCGLAAVALYVKLLQVYPLIISQNNQFAQAFVAEDSNMETAVENFFRFIALCINIAGLYQEPSRVNLWSAHRIKDTWLMGRLYNRSVATVLLYHLNVSHWVAKRAFWQTVKKRDLIVCAPEGFNTSDSLLNI